MWVQHCPGAMPGCGCQAGVGTAGQEHKYLGACWDLWKDVALHCDDWEQLQLGELGGRRRGSGRRRPAHLALPCSRPRPLLLSLLRPHQRAAVRLPCCCVQQVSGPCARRWNGPARGGRQSGRGAQLAEAPGPASPLFTGPATQYLTRPCSACWLLAWVMAKRMVSLGAAER